MINTSLNTKNNSYNLKNNLNSSVNKNPLTIKNKLNSYNFNNYLNSLNNYTNEINSKSTKNDNQIKVKINKTEKNKEKENLSNPNLKNNTACNILYEEDNSILQDTKPFKNMVIDLNCVFIKTLDETKHLIKLYCQLNKFVLKTAFGKFHIKFNIENYNLKFEIELTFLIPVKDTFLKDGSIIDNTESLYKNQYILKFKKNTGNSILFKKHVYDILNKINS